MPVEIIIIVSIIIFIAVIIEIFIELTMRKMFSHRGDGCLRFSYPMPSDFPCLSKQKFSVKSHKNVINGIIYKDINQSSYKKIIILSTPQSKAQAEFSSLEVPCWLGGLRIWCCH